jgi:hypothetical protein
VLDYLGANGVQVEETMLESSSMTKPMIDKLKEKYGIEADFEYGEYLFTNEDGDDLEYYDLPQGARDIADDLARFGETQDSTKYSKYSVPGGENYKELLLTLPRKFKAKEYSYEEALFQMQNFNNPIEVKANGVFVKNLTQEWQLKDNKADIDSGKYTLHQYDLGAGNMTDDKSYKSSHFDQANILAHVRFDERTDADGSKVLFIQEVQSDWGQDGKKKGFTDTKPFKVIDGNTKAEVAEFKTQQESFDYVKANRKSNPYLIDSYKPQAPLVPTAPFVTKTDAWVSLAIKRMMRYAADNGFDKVAFITGEQAADLYDLSKQISRVNAVKDFDGKTYTIGAFDNNGREVLQRQEVQEDKLADYVGKDLAEKIVAMKNGEGKQFKGLDLKVGGEGMRTFYDSIVPKVANDVLKKVGGGKVENVEIDTRQPEDNSYYEEITDENIINPTGFTITQEIQEKILGGLPLFNRESNAPAGLPKAAIQKAVNLLKSNWKTHQRLS